MRQAVRVASYRLRATFHRQWGGYLTVVVLIAVVGGVAMGAVAGARRTDSSFPTYLASTNPSTTELITGFDNPALGQRSGYSPRVNAEIAHLPLVEHTAVQIGFDGNIDLASVTGVHPHLVAGETPPTVIGGDEFLTEDRMTLVDGRLANPRRTGEAVMNAEAANELGLHIGSVVGIPIYTDAETTSPTYNGPPHLVAKVEIVGVVVFSSSVVQDDIEALGSAVIFLSAALTDELSGCCATYSGVALQLHGGDASSARVAEEIARVAPITGLGIGGGASTPSVVADKAQRAIRPEAVALGVFGGIAGLAVLLIVGLVISRILRARAAESETLRALGADPKMRLGDHLIGVLGAVLAGSLLAVGVAIGLSPLTLLGPVRPVYPNPGLATDWTVLILGLFGLVVVLASIGVIVASAEIARLRTPHRGEVTRRRPRPLRSVVASGFWLPIVTGLRFALDPGKGRDAVPVRSAMFGSVLAVAVLVTTVTFGSSLNNLVSHPPLYGWNWNAAILSGFAGQEDLPEHQISVLLDHDRDISAWSGANFIGAKLDGQHVEVMTQEPRAAVSLPILSGHGLKASDEAVLGKTTLAALHKQVGDTVTLVGGGRSHRLLIVGTATMSTIAKGFEMGSGALVATSDFPTSLLNAQGNSIPGPNAVLVRVRTGVSTTAAGRSLQGVADAVNAIRGDPGSAGGVVSVLRPAEIVDYRSMGTTPAILGAGLAAGAMASLGLTLVASVRRRRRDLAVLKTLGFTGRQLSAAVAWQSSTAVLIGTIMGVPIGSVVGRLLWELFAGEIDAVPVAVVPVVPIALVVVGVFVLANLVAALPRHMAARTPTALLLRAE